MVGAGGGATRLFRIERLYFLGLGVLQNPIDLVHVAVDDREQAGVDKDPTISGDRQLVSKHSDWFSLAETFSPIQAKLNEYSRWNLLTLRSSCQII